jgi:hypothetical protein
VARGSFTPSPPSPGSPAEQPPPGAAGLQSISFEAIHRDQTYNVIVGESSCRTPCTLRLPPGPVKLQVKGDGRFTRELVVPPHAATVKLNHLSLKKLITGASMVTLSIPMIGTGAWMLDVYLKAERLYSQTGYYGISNTERTAYVATGGILLGVGLGMLAAGVPGLIRFGRNQATIVDDARASRPA